MTDPLLTMEPERISVEPGGQVSVTITVSNFGTIVEGYDLDVVTESPITWVQVLPPTVSVYPQQQQTVVVVFTPPAGTGAPGGVIPFGVRARSQVDASASSVVEGEVEVGRVFGLQAKLTPVTSSGRWRARHTLQVSNWGNAPARLRLVASDPDQALGYLVQPDVVDVPLGGTTTARIKVKTRQPTLRGTPRRLPFQVVCEPDPPRPPSAPVSPVSDPSRPVVDGAFMQKPILSRGVVAVAATVAVVAIAAAGIFAFTRPKPLQTHQDLGPPTAPTNFAASAPQTDTVTLSWTGVARIEKYSLLYIDPQTHGIMKNEDVSASLNEFKPALAPGTKYCFELQAVRGKYTSDPTAATCATTLAPPVTGASGPSSPGTSGPSSGSVSGQPSTPGGSQTTGAPGQLTTIPDGQWVGFVQLLVDSAPGAQATITSAQQHLVASGIAAKVIHTSDFPGFNIPNPAWALIVGPESTSTSATTDCQSAALPQGCQFVRQLVSAPTTPPAS